MLTSTRRPARFHFRMSEDVHPLAEEARRVADWALSEAIDVVNIFEFCCWHIGSGACGIVPEIASSGRTAPTRSRVSRPLQEGSKRSAAERQVEEPGEV
jgi:hypothetical protein